MAEIIIGNILFNRTSDRVHKIFHLVTALFILFYVSFVMSLFTFGFTSSKKRKGTDENEDEKRKQQKDEQKRERRYLKEIWEKKYVYYPTPDGKPESSFLAKI